MITVAEDPESTGGYFLMQFICLSEESARTAGAAMIAEPDSIEEGSED